MYPISRDYRNDVQCAEVVEVDSLLRTCQLVPRFGRRANRALAWTSSNIIDRCDHFLINKFIDHVPSWCDVCGKMTLCTIVFVQSVVANGWVMYPTSKQKYRTGC